MRKGTYNELIFKDKKQLYGFISINSLFKREITPLLIQK